MEERSAAFYPSRFLYKGAHPNNSMISRFDYDDYHLLWSAVYLSDDCTWDIILAWYTAVEGLEPSEQILEGFYREGCIDPRLPVKTYEKRSGKPEQLLHYSRQKLPEAPVIDFDRLSRFSDSDREKILSFEHPTEVLLTLDVPTIRQELRLPESLSDGTVLTAAHRHLSTMPFIRGSRRIESTRWLHERRLTVSFPEETD